MGRVIDLVGRKFGRWTVISKSKIRFRDREIYWECVCDCGNEKLVRGVQLRNRISNSCGCIRSNDLKLEKELYNRD